MLTVNPVKLLKVNQVTFKNNNESSRVGLMALDKNAGNKINFEKDLFITQNADSVQSNPIKAIGYSIVKAYNILSTPRKNSANVDTKYIHIPYMA